MAIIHAPQVSKYEFFETLYSRRLNLHDGLSASALLMLLFLIADALLIADAKRRIDFTPPAK